MVHIFINSAHRDNGTNARPTFFISGAIGANSASRAKLAIQSASVPYSWTNITSGVNDEFIVNSTTYYLTAGSPSASELVSDFNTVQSVFTAAYDSKTNKITFTQTVGTDTLEPTNCGHLFGLDDGTEYTGTTTSTKPVDMQYVHMVVVHSDIDPGRTLSSYSGGSGFQRSTALLAIPVGSTEPWDRIVYQNGDSDNWLGVQSSSTATFWLTDERGNVLDPSGDWFLFLRSSI